MYADIQSHNLPGGGNAHPHLLVTAQKPDLVIIDRIEEKMDIFELTTHWKQISKMQTLKRHV